jgi:hypothetical protein
MKNTIYATCLIMLVALFSCKQDPNMPPQNLNKNYTFILDLSDRLTAPNQCEKDIAIIEQIFTQFENQAKSKLTIGSKDAFSVLIIPQKGSALDGQKHELALQIDLQSVNTNVKVKTLNEFKTNLRTRLQNLYKEAYKGPNNNAYFGVDIWEYLNNYAGRICNDNRVNNVILLTDGYFDFANNGHVLKQGNKITSTQFLSNLKGTDWQKTATDKNYGLIPIAMGNSCNYIIAGLHNKSINDIQELTQLKYFWQKWLSESTKGNNFSIVEDANCKVVEGQILRALK